ncbi:collagen-like protein [Streptomyces montanisoli]|uniref:Collagen-like protein n=1 Tax=Streptomyces montanisoli TaxID=2798581 RepID=A0A940M7L3_9ACTN|nr:collagen-like protein [Streptomyces montanisoli]MBP0456259.1 collagen-like protein [Streptomyces montanisoli]
MLPEGIPTVTVTGRYLFPDGRPLSGQVVFRAPALLTFADDDVILGGPVTASLDEQGAFKVTLPATDAPGMNPGGWSYAVAEQFASVAQNRTYQILLPAESPAVDIADLAPTDPTTPNYVAVRGDSAYEVAVAQGFVGTVEQWLASLVGPQGEQGLTGEQGPQGVQGPQGDTGPQGPPGVVQSVNGQAVAEVELGAVDVHAVPDTAPGAAGGVAQLGDDGKVPAAQLPTLGAVESVNEQTGAVVLDAADVQAIPAAEKGADNGVAPLNEFGNVPTANLPDLSGSYVAVSTRGAAGGVATLDSAGIVPAAQLPPPSNEFRPADLALKAWAFDPGLGQSEVKYPSSGSLRVTAVQLHNTETVSSIVWHLFGYNAGITAGDAGIFDSSGARLRTTGDLSVSGKVPQEHGVGGHTYAIPLTSSVTLAPGIYYLAFWMTYTSGNGPGMLVSESNGNFIPTFYGLNNTIRFGVDLSATGLPSSLNLSSFGKDENTTSPNKFWQGLA